MNKVRS